MDYRHTLREGVELDGQYRILGLLGHGGFANTYRALDLSLDREVAIKEYMPGDLAVRGADASVQIKTPDLQKTFVWGLERFVQEARTLAKFKNPNIVRVFTWFSANATAYIVLELVRGMTLEDWLKQLGRPPTQDELDALSAPLLDALSLVHAERIWHRDIKPDNIYIRAADRAPVLLDFGAAKYAVAGEARRHSTLAIVSRGYSPNEAYARDSTLHGPWTDIYGLSATFYRALSGDPPPEATERVLQDSIVPAGSLALPAGAYRPAFLQAVDWGLSVWPQSRPQSVGEWRDALLGSAAVSLPPAASMPLPHMPRMSGPVGTAPPRSGPFGSASASGGSGKVSVPAGPPPRSGPAPATTPPMSAPNSMSGTMPAATSNLLQPASGPAPTGPAAATSQPVPPRPGAPMLVVFGLLLVLGGGGTLAAWQVYGDKLFGSLPRIASLQTPTPAEPPRPTPAEQEEARRRANQDAAEAAERARRDAEQKAREAELQLQRKADADRQAAAAEAAAREAEKRRGIEQTDRAERAARIDQNKAALQLARREVETERQLRVEAERKQAAEVQRETAEENRKHQDEEARLTRGADRSSEDRRLMEAEIQVARAQRAVLARGRHLERAGIMLDLAKGALERWSQRRDQARRRLDDARRQNRDQEETKPLFELVSLVETEHQATTRAVSAASEAVRQAERERSTANDNSVKASDALRLASAAATAASAAAAAAADVRRRQQEEADRQAKEEEAARAERDAAQKRREKIAAAAAAAKAAKAARERQADRERAARKATKQIRREKAQPVVKRQPRQQAPSSSPTITGIR